MTFSSCQSLPALAGSGPRPDLRREPAAVSSATLARLRKRLRGKLRGRLCFDGGSRALYATDGSLYRQLPLGVLIPETVDDVVAAVEACHALDVPVLPRGGGTSLAGQCCNAALVMDFSHHLDRVLALDPENRCARVQPGCVLDVLRDAAQVHNLTFAPDPSTHAHNTLGGMLGNNSCGVHSLMGGRTVDNVISLDVLTHDGLRLRVGQTGEQELERLAREPGRTGEIYSGIRRLRERYAELIRRRYPHVPRRVSGYALDALLPENGCHVARALVGSEGTLVTILEAELRLVHSPPVRHLLVLGYADVYRAADHVPQILQHGPVGLEGLDCELILGMAKKQMRPEDRRLLPEGGGWLLVEMGGETEHETAARVRRLMDALRRAGSPPSMALFTQRAQQERIWKLRESGLGATAHVPGEHETHPGWEDAAVPPEHLGAYLRDFRALTDKYGYHCALYGHFGDGCVHCRIDFEMKTETGVAQWHAFMEEAADLVVRYGGSLSGEHGDGQVRAELLPKMYGAELMDAFREFKALWDPGWKMNPGKVVDPYPMRANLRSGPDFHPPLFRTELAYPEDGHSFARAANRCVGIGDCRNLAGGVMCPSYRATRDERYSTRGRARLLFEMIKGGPIGDGWKNEAVRDALDLCLACKGCKSDCPVNVDMATYKAEFMAHHYRGRLRPREAYSMGLIYTWSRIAEKLPWAANFVLQTPGLSALAKRIGGLAPQRRLPRYAAESFRRWFARRPPPAAGAPQVLLFPDTFNNHFHPQPLKSAVSVLEAAGFGVRIPRRPLCCARPLYAEGMLDRARSQLGDILDTLGEEMALNLPVVGLEPSCVASFRDELPRLFPADERALYLSRNTFILSEFLEREGFRPPGCRARPSCISTATITPRWTRRPRSSCCSASGSICRCSTPAAAAWRARSASARRPTRFRSASPSTGCYRRCARRVASRCSSPTASAAASRSSRTWGLHAMSVAEVLDLALRGEGAAEIPLHRLPQQQKAPS